MSLEDNFVPEVDDDAVEGGVQGESTANGESVETTSAESGGESVQKEETQTAMSGEAQAAQDAMPPGLDQRYLADQWIARYPEGPFLKYSDGEWKEVAEEESDLIQQLWYEQEAQEVQTVDGVKMKWNRTTEQWMPVEEVVDDDFIAQYQASYGVAYDYSQMEVKKDETALEKAKEETEKKEKKEAHKGPAPQGWLDMEEKVFAVYVSNLPLDIDEDEFQAFMAKAGIIQVDPRGNKPKIKLYRDAEGKVKGDGRCCYVKKESIELALTLLDGALFNGSTVKVERAHFELKGDYDPTKKKKKLTAQQKKRFLEQQNKLFEWQPEKPRNYRPKHECTVIVCGLFTLEEMQKNAALLLDLKEEMKNSCAKYGIVKKVVVYDNNPEGVVSVHFTNTEESDLAVKMMNNRIVDGKLLKAFHWDGKTKYQREETEEERQKRLSEWNRFVESDEDSASDSEKEGEGEESSTSDQAQAEGVVRRRESEDDEESPEAKRKRLEDVVTRAV